MRRVKNEYVAEILSNPFSFPRFTEEKVSGVLRVNVGNSFLFKKMR